MVKIRGGYLPKIAGRPSEMLEERPCPATLSIELAQNGISYVPSVQTGSEVELGQKLGSADVNGTQLVLPSPSSGTVTVEENEGRPVRISVKCSKVSKSSLKAVAPSALPADIGSALAAGGVLQAVWCSATEGVPSLKALPQAIIVSLSLTEPFRPSSAVVWKKWEGRITKGMELLGRLIVGEGRIHIMCAGDEPQALNGIKALGGDRKLFHEVPHTYPVENPALITKALRKAGAIDRNDLVWVMDLQTVAAAGACLAEGVPLSQRIVASGGPAMAEPRHFLVTVGTPVNTVVPPKDNLLVLRGGLFKGMPVDSQNGTIGLADDALFAMPAAGKREMFAFINPGFNRRSIYPSCISTLTGAPDSHLSGTIRGERRPCVACSSCEKVCPAELMPQAIHRLLYGQEYDDAEALGLNLCVNCGACTYVCPSKIDLNSQFVEARRIIKAEKEAADAIAANTGKKK